jgi:hypothetical protein
MITYANSFSAFRPLCRSGILIFILFLTISFSFKSQAFQLTIHGPSEVCPGTQAYTWTVTNSLGGWFCPESYSWRLLVDGVAQSGSLQYGSSGIYTFDEELIGHQNVQVEVTIFSPTGSVCNGMSTSRNVNVRLKDAAAITGPSTVCNGQIVTYSSLPRLGNNWDDCYFSGGYVWTLPQGWDIISSDPTSETITVKIPDIGGGAGYKIKVRAVHYGFPNQLTQEREITVQLGPPSSFNYTITGPSQACPGEYLYFTAPLDTDVTYSWGWPANWNYVSGQGTRFLDIQAPYNNFNGGAILLYISNSCGASSSHATKFVSESYNCNYMYSFNVYPNPADREIFVELEGVGENEVGEI